MAASFPTKPSWLKAIKNKQYALWPGLTWEVVNKHFPKSKETFKGQGRKTRSGLRSTKTSPQIDNDDKIASATQLTRSPTKQKEAIICTFDLSNEAKRLMYINQTIVAQSHQEQAVRIVAGPHMGGGQQAFP